jgi:hypothetical protein
MLTVTIDSVLLGPLTVLGFAKAATCSPTGVTRPLVLTSDSVMYATVQKQ